MYGCMDVWMYGCMDVWMDGAGLAQASRLGQRHKVVVPGQIVVP